MFYSACMSERPGLQPRPDVPVTAAFFDGRWSLEARADPYWCRVTATPPVLGECARSAVHHHEYLAIHVDAWTDEVPSAPLAHAEWHDVAELIARFEGEHHGRR
jgi:hypothetical protein